MSCFDPPLIGVGGGHRRSPFNLGGPDGRHVRCCVPSGCYPAITWRGRPTVTFTMKAPKRPTPCQDNDRAKGLAMLKDLTAIIDALDYIEADVECVVPLVAIDIRRASEQLRQLVCRGDSRDGSGRSAGPGYAGDPHPTRPRGERMS